MPIFDKIKLMTLIISATTIFTLTAPAKSETTEWIRLSKFHHVMNSIGKKGYLPTRVKCRYDSGANRIDGRLTYEKSSKTAMTWDITVSFNTVSEAREMKAKGFKLVNTSTVRSDHGSYNAKCQLWHKKR